jgi:hypothetical protein
MSKVREILLNFIESNLQDKLDKKMTVETLNSRIAQSETAIREAILLELPKMRFLFAGNVEANKGYNLCLEEVRKEIGG